MKTQLNTWTRRCTSSGRCWRHVFTRLALHKQRQAMGTTNSITGAGAAQVTAGDEATYSALVNCKMHSGSVVFLLEDRRSASLLDTVHPQVMFRPLTCNWHAGSGKDPSLAKASSLSVPLCIQSVTSPPSSTSSGFVAFTHQRVRQCVGRRPDP